MAIFVPLLFLSLLRRCLAFKLPAVDDSLCSISGKPVFLFVGKPSFSKGYATVVVLSPTAASWKEGMSVWIGFIQLHAVASSAKRSLRKHLMKYKFTYMLRFFFHLALCVIVRMAPHCNLRRWHVRVLSARHAVSPCANYPRKSLALNKNGTVCLPHLPNRWQPQFVKARLFSVSAPSSRWILLAQL